MVIPQSIFPSLVKRIADLVEEEDWVSSFRTNLGAEIEFIERNNLQAQLAFGATHRLRDFIVLDLKDYLEETGIEESLLTTDFILHSLRVHYIDILRQEGLLRSLGPKVTTEYIIPPPPKTFRESDQKTVWVEYSRSEAVTVAEWIARNFPEVHRYCYSVKNLAHSQGYYVFREVGYLDPLPTAVHCADRVLFKRPSDHSLLFVHPVYEPLASIPLKS